MVTSSVEGIVGQGARDRFAERKARMVAKAGGWVARNIVLPSGHTISPGVAGEPRWSSWIPIGLQPEDVAVLEWREYRGQQYNEPAVSEDYRADVLKNYGVFNREQD
jgi:hypothetical protein